MTSVRAAHDQRGAALAIVLLLVATLTFILLSISTLMSGGVRRAGAERIRTELLWRAVTAERLAEGILKEAQEQKALRNASGEGGLFTRQLTLPVDGGEAMMRFADASRCFNVNSLVTSDDGAYAENAEAGAELAELLKSLGVGDGEAAKFVSVLTDWLDSDVSQGVQGAEDGFYTALPTPFRTGGGPIASVSELRAMEGVNAALYRQISPYLCTGKVGALAKVNVNALEERHAPVIAAMTKGAWALPDIRAQINAKPPGGWPETVNFWAPYAAAGREPPADRVTLAPEWVEARVVLSFGGRDMEETMMFSLSEGSAPRLAFRVFGADR